MYFFPLMCLFSPLKRVPLYHYPVPPFKSQLYLLLVKLLICSDSFDESSVKYVCSVIKGRYATLYLCLPLFCGLRRGGCLLSYKLGLGLKI